MNRTYGRWLRSGVVAVAMLASSLAHSVTFEIIQSPTPEGAGTLDAIVRLSATAAETANGDCDVSVDFLLQTGAPSGRAVATPSADYVDVSGSDFISLPQNQTSDVSAQIVVSIPLVDDQLVEPIEEGVILLVDGFAQGQLGCFGQTLPGLDADLVILDDDPMVFSWTTPVTANETDPNVTAELVFQNPSAIAGNTFSARIDYATADGTAQAPGDYVAVTSFFNFTHEDPPDPQSQLVTIVDDTVPESNEDFAVLDTNLTALVDGFPAGITISNTFEATIIDDDNGAVPELSFVATSINVLESDGTATLDLSLSIASPTPVTVDFVTADGTAVAGSDYTTSSGSVTFPPNSVAPQTIVVPLVDDTIVEGAENFAVALSNAAGATLSPTASTATVNITDDDSPPIPGTVQFTASEITVNELAGTVTIEVSRVGGTAGAAAVNFASVQDTATDNVDFTPVAGTLNWAGGNADVQTVTVAILADTIAEGVEDFTVVLSNATGATLGTPNVFTISITDLGRDIAGIPGLSTNQREMGGWFDANCENLIASNPVDPQQQDLARACQGLRDINTTDGQVRDGLDAVNAEELATAAITTIRLLGDQHGNLQRRINGLRSGATGVDLAGLDLTVGGQQISGAAVEEILHGLTWGAVGGESDFGRWGFFVDGKVDFGERDRNEENNGYSLDSTLITVGADYRVRDNFFIGSAFGYADAKVNFNGGGGLDFDNYRASVYTTYFASDTFYIDALVTYGTLNYNSERRISFTDSLGTIDRTASGSTDGTMFTAGIGTGFDFSIAGFTFGPNIGTYLYDVDVDAYSESGAGGLNLNIGDQGAQSHTINAGGHASWVFNAGFGVVIPFLRFDYVHEFKDGIETVGVRFAADPFQNDPVAPSTPIIVRSELPDKDYLVWSVGASAQFVRGFSGFFSYQRTEAYKNLNLNEVSFGMRYEKTF